MEHLYLLSLLVSPKPQVTYSLVRHFSLCVIDVKWDVSICTAICGQIVKIDSRLY